MASQDTRLSKFEADFKQQQSEMTNKIETFLKAINDQMTGALPSDTVKNPKLNVNSTSPVLSARSYPIEDPQSLSHIRNSINAIKTCSKQTNESQKDQSKVKTLTVNEIGTPKSKKPKQTLKDEFKDLHLNLPVLEILAHAPMYNVILDRYVKSLKLGKKGSTFIQGEMPKKIKDPGLVTMPCRLGDSKPLDTLADLGSSNKTKSYPVGIVKNVEVHIGRLKLLEDFYVIDMEKDPTTPLVVGRGFLATASAVIDYKKAKIAIGEGVTRSEIARDAELNPFKDVLVFRKMVEFLGSLPINLKGNTWELEELIKEKIDWNRPPKEGDAARHIRIELIDPDGERFKKTFQSILTTRKLSKQENRSEIIDLDHLHDF
ncbi:DNA-directed DNA polymerase [Tanacetum coccineum]